MSSKIYKYFSAGVLDLVFARPAFCGIKCSLPKDYNDPYELFQRSIWRSRQTCWPPIVN